MITRLQVQSQFRRESSQADAAEYKNIQDALFKIYTQEGGIRAFYSGVAQDTAKSAADSFLFFLAYNYLRTHRRANGSSRHLPMAEELGVGMLAGAFAKALTTPIQNIVTRKQTAAMVHSRSRSSSLNPELSTKDIALQIRAEKGILGFWSGYSASLILTLNPALTFLLHETFLRALVTRERRADPGARTTFLIAAASKAIASTITYPFSLAKARAQVSGERPVDSASHISEKDTIEEAERKLAAKAKRNTILGSILHIARTEGLSGLYRGLGGEVLKGFFAHGITMLLKERIHALVIQLYYVVLKALRKYPSPQEIASGASQQAQAVMEQGKSQVKDAYERSAELASNASKQAKSFVDKGREQVGDVYEKGAEMVNSGKQQVQAAFQTEKVPSLEKGKEMITDAAANAKGAAQAGARRAQETASSGSQSAKDAVSRGVSQVRQSVQTEKVAPGDVYGKGKEMSSDVVASAKEAVQSGTERAQNLVGSGNMTMKEGLDRAREAARGAAKDASRQVKGALGKEKDTVPAGDVYMKGKDGAKEVPADKK